MKVIVVGAGIVGASTAYHLAREGVEVVVVDYLHEGQATAAGAGIVCPWISSGDDNHPDLYTLANAGACYYPSLISMLGQDGETNVSYRLVGAMAVNSDEAKLDAIEQMVRKRQSETPEVGEIRRLSPAEAQALFPPLNSGLGAVYVTGAARVDGKLMRDALNRAAQKHGALYQSGEADLEAKDGKVVGVRVKGQFISADAVVVTAGAWISKVLEPLGIDVSIVPQRGQIIHLEVPGHDTSNWPVILPQNDHYLVSFDHSRVVVGATRETGAGFDYRVTTSGVKEVLDKALSIAPGLANGTLKEIRIGFRPFGKELSPLIGLVPSMEGLVIANGLGASGLTMGPYVGLTAANLVLGNELDLDLTPFNPLRKVTV
ncbi:D-amino-acid dehydrogenase [Bacillus thermophilus]|uniref:D-amino-acid dehydrogenase n=1 Tax=Siminovitchia thermophila TaxID=1245522 RepID=A0ABS2R5Y5_9BACI|nr:FAD-binding oxidoreductase [Siminovitchia thermophila]MBM7715013.1 D-amino-acid dehydrogenase [Siminovitchia thermophila]ONK22377.1 oxidoreductase [Bacillus sp. VT-16-64]